MLLIARVALVAAALLLWLAPLLRERHRNRSRPAQTLDHRARWGVILELTGYLLLWATDFWNQSPATGRLVVAIALLVFAVTVSFLAARALGSHLRIDAGLDPDHQLVRSGPYRWVRHPVYTSFFCLILGTGLMITPWPLLLLASAVFLCGTEIRVRIEDRLLAARFGAEFAAYHHSVPAYLPGLR